MEHLQRVAMKALSISLFAWGIVALGCAPAPCPPGGFPAQSSPSVAATAAEPAEAQPVKVAVMPIVDDELFRDERTAVRAALFAALAQRAELSLVPLDEVEGALRPLSKAGVRCAFDETPLERRLSGRGWGHTALLRVFGEAGAPPERWVRISHYGEMITYSAPEDPALEGVAAYLKAFAQLTRDDEAAVLGGLGASGSDQHALVAGPLTICENENFGACKARSSAWGDRAEAMAACYGEGVDEAADELLLDPGAKRCELTHLDDLESHRAPREACLCGAALGSAGLAGAERTRLRVGYRAPNLKDRVEPRLRVIDVTQNLYAEEDYAREGNRAVERLVVSNLDALAAPLARCEPSSSPVVAEVSIGEAGSVQATRLLTPGPSACIERALGAGRFACTDDGKTATLRLLVEWPATKPR